MRARSTNSRGGLETVLRSPRKRRIGMLRNLLHRLTENRQTVLFEAEERDRGCGSAAEVGAKKLAIWRSLLSSLGMT